MRKRQSEAPKSPLDYNQRVVCRTKAGLTITGKVTFIGYILFPGVWSSEVTTDEGQVYKTHGAEYAGAALVKLHAAEEPAIDHAEAGAQLMAPGTDGRRTIPDAKLKPKKLQLVHPTAIEKHEINSKQQSLF